MQKSFQAQKCLFDVSAGALPATVTLPVTAAEGYVRGDSAKTAFKECTVAGQAQVS